MVVRGIMLVWMVHKIENGKSDAKKLYFEFKCEKDKNKMVFIKMMLDWRFMIFEYFLNEFKRIFL